MAESSRKRSLSESDLTSSTVSDKRVTTLESYDLTFGSQLLTKQPRILLEAGSDGREGLPRRLIIEFNPSKLLIALEFIGCFGSD